MSNRPSGKTLLKVGGLAVVAYVAAPVVISSAPVLIYWAPLAWSAYSFYSSGIPSMISTARKVANGIVYMKRMISLK